MICCVYTYRFYGDSDFYMRYYFGHTKIECDAQFMEHLHEFDDFMATCDYGADCVKTLREDGIKIDSWYDFLESSLRGDNLLFDPWEYFTEDMIIESTTITEDEFQQAENDYEASKNS